MKFFKIGIVCLTLAAFGSAQDYHITDFIPDSIDTWKVSARLNASSTREKDVDKYHDQTADSLKNRRDVKYSYNSFSPTIYYYKNKITKDSEFNIYANTGFSLTRNTNGTNLSMMESGDEYYDSKTINNTSSISENIHINYLKYLESGLAYGGSFNFNGHNYRRRTKSFYRNDGVDKYTNDDLYKKNTPVTTLSLTGQKGRVYSGAYAAKAEEIIMELKKEGLLVRDLSKAEYLKLSQLILTRKTLYHYDSRIKMKEDLVEVTNYLKSIGAINSDNTAAVVTIDDTYRYTAGSNRYFGNKIYARLDYSMERSKTVTEEEDVYYTWTNNSFVKDTTITDDSETIKKYRTPMLTLGYQMNMIDDYHNWRTYEGYFSLGREKIIYDKGYSNTKDDIYGMMELGVLADFYRQWTPRSVASVHFDNIIYRETDKNAEDAFWTYTFDLSGSFTYYLTPKIYANGSAGLAYIAYYDNEKAKYSDSRGHETDTYIRFNIYWTL